MRKLTGSNPFPEHSRGFTLVEVSIVLVIIGLLVGGIMAGRSLIQAAEKKAQIEQNARVISAVLAFRDRYFALPGDISTATKFFSAASQPEQVLNGNGDGRIGRFDGACTSADCTAGTNVSWALWHPNPSIAESTRVFEHLVAAGLIEFHQYDDSNAAAYAIGDGTYPMKFSGTSAPAGIMVGHEARYMYLPGGHYVRWNFCANNGFGCGMRTEDAWQFDAKMDDGLPFTGKVFLGGQVYVFRVPGDVNDEIGTVCTPTHNYTAASDNQYYLNNVSGSANLKRCNIIVKAPF